jgi:hypothetical protein
VEEGINIIVIKSNLKIHLANELGYISLGLTRINLEK